MNTPVPFIGEIQLFGFNFNPNGWAFCDGTALPIGQNTALFSLLGTTYGGNGRDFFRLPNYAGRAICGQGQGPELSPRNLGVPFGVRSVTLAGSQLPAHTHGINAFFSPDASKRSHAPSVDGGLSMPGVATNKAFSSAEPNTNFSPNTVTPNTGGGGAHDNLQPYLAMNFCIALSGEFPDFE